MLSNTILSFNNKIIYTHRILQRNLSIYSTKLNRQILNNSSGTNQNLFKFKFINNSDTTSTDPNNKNTNIKKWTSHSLPTTNKHSFIKNIIQTNTQVSSTNNTSSNGNIDTATPTKKKKRKLRARKAVITLTPNAIIHLKALLNSPEPKLIRVSTKNRGCSGTTYDLSYVTKPEKFDEVVEQDGVKIIIDSKALFSVVGSEMDWIDDKLNSKFIFQNPNSKGTCGCGESFMT